MVDYGKMASQKLNRLPPYLFARIDKLKDEALKKGVDVIDLSVGDPDIPTPPYILEAMFKALGESANHQYPSYAGKYSFREAAALWCRQRFGVDFDPGSEVLALIGSKEGIGHMPFAFLDPGDVCLVPDPGYPVYRACTLLAGGEPYNVPLLRENGFLPDLASIPDDVARRAKLMFINYPNNPTSALADRGFFQKAADFARRHAIALCHDAAYSEIYFLEEDRPPSLLEAEGAKEVAVEFHSLSKSWNMTGWRIGFVVGNPEILASLGKIKSNIDSGAFGAIQDAGVAALTGSGDFVASMREVYSRRRDVFCQGLSAAGLEANPPRASLYVWIPVPSGQTSEDFTGLLLKEAGLVTTPGVGFGGHGEGYIRISLTVGEEALEEAAHRLSRLSF
jgi:LL-diaminopimelate aminotransferase